MKMRLFGINVLRGLIARRLGARCAAIFILVGERQPVIDDSTKTRTPLWRNSPVFSVTFILVHSGFICLHRSTDSPGATKSAQLLIRLKAQQRMRCAR
jgi:hypothetical protein